MQLAKEVEIDPRAIALAVETEIAMGYERPVDYRNSSVEYIDPAPRSFVVQIPLVEYFERVTRHKADEWQVHFCEYLQDAAIDRPTKAAKTIIHAQARLGKSRILAQVYPAWLLGHDPLHRIALATYNKTQSEGHSEAVISIMNLPVHKAIFPDPAGWVNPSVAKDRWRTAARKESVTDTERSFNAVGLQSGLTGAGFDCFPAETLVETEIGPIEIGQLFVLKYTPKVYAFNHLTNSVELRNIEALREMPADELVEIRTKAGRTIRCTPNHRIYVGGRYITADAIRQGDKLQSLPDVRQLQELRERCLFEVPFRSQTSDDRQGVSSLLEGIPDSSVRRDQSAQERTQEQVLLGILCSEALLRYESEKDQRVQNMQRDYAGNLFGSSVLFESVSAQESAANRRAPNLPSVLDQVSAQEQSHDVLRESLREQGTFETYDRQGQFPVHFGPELREVVSGDEADRYGTGRAQVRRLRSIPEAADGRATRYPGGTQQASYPSHQSQTRSEPGDEPRHSLRSLSQGPSQLGTDTVAMVRRIRGGSISVYDLQVEGCGNFFAEQILVHNSLIIDDPYADAAEAFSPTVRKKLTTHFWEFTVKSRIGLHSNVFGMFHRYHMEDLAGYLLDTGKFDYLRYASIADGDYIHKKTGQRFPDPLRRKDGEYISERFTKAYYADKRDNSQVWNSMFQGRPASEQGDFFHVDKIRILKGDELEEYRSKCAIWIRSWDNAATKNAGDHSAGALLGMHPDGSVLIDDMKLAQLDPAGRMELQKGTAVADGIDVIITVPEEVGEAGKSLVFFAQQYLRGFQVKGRSVVNSQNPGDTAKKRRAWNYSIAVNSCQVAFANDDHLPDDKKWVDRVVEAMRTFGFTSFDDPIDGMSDAYNEAHERLTRGPVITSFYEPRNLLTIDKFAARFPSETNGQPFPKIPERFTIYAGVKISADATLPNSAAIVARAPEIANMPDKLFLVAEYKNWTGDMYECFDWLDISLKEYCDNSKAAIVWLHPDSEEYAATIQRKLKRTVSVFDGSDTAGLTELGWYMLPTSDSSPFNQGERDTRFYGIVRDPEQLVSPVDSLGLAAFRQECASWSFDKDGTPNAIGGVADCVRMIASGFRTRADRLTREERAERDHVNPRFRGEAIQAAVEDGASKDEISRRQVTRTVQLNMPKVLKGGNKNGSRFAKFKR